MDTSTKSFTDTMALLQRNSSWHLFILSLALLCSCNENGTAPSEDTISSSSIHATVPASSGKIATSSSLITIFSSQRTTSSSSTVSPPALSSSSATIKLDCPAILEDNTFCDARNGVVYKSTTIGKQTWMAENLRLAKPGAWCAAGGDCKPLGHLFTYAATKDVCPKGWRLPSDSDWVELAEFAKGQLTIYNQSDTCYAGAGTKLRATDDWLYPELDRATDEFGFKALPTGEHTDEKIDFGQSEFLSGSTAYFWSSTTTAEGYGHSWNLSSGATCLDMFYQHNDLVFYHSVRCIEE